MQQRNAEVAAASNVEEAAEEEEFETAFTPIQKLEVSFVLFLLASSNLLD